MNKTEDDVSDENITVLPPTSFTQVDIHREKRYLRFNRELVNLFFVTGMDGVAEIDFCSVIHCKENQKAHVFSEKYICETYAGTRFPRDRRCGSWEFVITNSGPHLWNYKPRKASTGPDPLTDRLTIIKGQFDPNCKLDRCNPLIITLKRPRSSDTGSYVLGSYEEGSDPLGNFMITVIDIKTATDNNKSYISTSIFITTPPPEPSPFPHVKYLTDLTYEDKLALETGYAARN